ncbi:MAG: ATP-binding cassette domain-containing protein [Candidatus Lokiarchaeota archaeon]
MKVIEVNDLIKKFENLKAVDKINFNVEEGEIFGFLGPNGAGKTTTIRMLTGVLKPTSGLIKIFGQDFWEDPISIKQRLGNVPEMSNVYIDLTGLENILLLGKLYGIPKNKRVERALDLLKKFELFERKDQKAKKYSKGMKQRLLLCMALISDPELLFLDEPTSGLDVQSSSIIKDLIKEYNDKGTTIFLTTHDMHVANDLCHRIAIINNGKIVGLNTPENLKEIIKEDQTIEFELNRMIEIAQLKNLETIKKIQKIKGRWRVIVENVDDAVNELTQFTKSNDLKIKLIKTKEPHLEEVFLKIINESDKN